MDRNRIVAVIMAGGEGTRFWPRSRRSRPKQFLAFDGEKTLLQLSVERLEGLVPKEQILVITGREHVELAREVSGLPERCIIGEPCLRDTAPCIGLGARLAESLRDDAVMVVLCADHLISPTDRFQADLLRAAELAADNDVLVTLGLRPDRPATGYGYIETGDAVDDQQPAARKVVRFREKPDLESARRFVLAGKFLWNSGMLAFRPETVLKGLAECRPDVHGKLMEIGDPWDAAEVERIYEQIPRISIDFAVLESAPNKMVVEASFDWDDLGTFEAVARHAESRGHGNLSRGLATFYESSGTLVDNDDGGLVVVAGVEDLLVVRTEDAVLVMPRKESEGVKAVVKEIEKQGLERFL
jgi:mannose-1-phosphate guanylyltransferase